MIVENKILHLFYISDTGMQEQFMGKFMVIILEVLKASEDTDAQTQLLNVFQILADNGRDGIHFLLFNCVLQDLTFMIC